MGNVKWQHTGPAREAGIEVPPTSIGNYGYALVYDAKRERIVYVRTPDYHAGLESWSWDGSAWTRDEQVQSEKQGGNETHAYFDSRRGAVIVCSVDVDYDRRVHVPKLVAVDATGSRPLTPGGEIPTIEPEGVDETFYSSSNLGCVVAFDEARGVGVCLTRNGIWELVGDTWTKRCGRPEDFPIKWQSAVGGLWDPVGNRCVLWLQQRGDGYGYRFYAWDGTTLTELTTNGLPSLHFGLFNPGAMVVAHPRHGVVCHVGGDRGMFALHGDTWRKLPDAKQPPPLMSGRAQCGQPQIAYDPGRSAFVVGPGWHEGHPGGSDAQRVFYVMRDGTWERQGVVARFAEIEALADNRKNAVAGGVWYSTQHRQLRTMKWTEAGWQEIVDEKTGEGLVGKERLSATAGGDTLYAVTNCGSVFRLESDRWERVSKASPAFKERDEFQLAHDGKRLVAWGGTVQNRKQNDTLVFDGTIWTPFKKTSAKPIDFKPPKGTYVDFHTIFDTTLGTLVRFGHAEVAVLQGEQWVPYVPKNYMTLCGSRKYNHLPAHDPVTGETLVIDFAAQRIVRFDLAACTEVATIEYDAALVEAAKKHHYTVYSHYSDAVVFDPATRTLQSQYVKDTWARYALDLGPVFDAADGPRTKLEIVEPKAKKKK